MTRHVGLSVLDLGLFEPVYTFVDKATGQPVHVASELLNTACKMSGWPIITANMAPSLVAAMEAGTLGVEEEHALKLPKAALDTPLLVLEYNDKSHVIADGAHRLWRRWKRGDTTFPCRVVPEPSWRMFEIYDMPGTGAEWDEFNRTAKIRHLMP